MSPVGTEFVICCMQFVMYVPSVGCFFVLVVFYSIHVDL